MTKLETGKRVVLRLLRGEPPIQLSLDLPVLSLDPEASAGEWMMDPRTVAAAVQLAQWRAADRVSQVEELERIYALRDGR